MVVLNNTLQIYLILCFLGHGGVVLPRFLVWVVSYESFWSMNCRWKRCVISLTSTLNCWFPFAPVTCNCQDGDYSLGLHPRRQAAEFPADPWWDYDVIKK